MLGGTQWSLCEVTWPCTPHLSTEETESPNETLMGQGEWAITAGATARTQTQVPRPPTATRNVPNGRSQMSGGSQDAPLSALLCNSSMF